MKIDSRVGGVRCIEIFRPRFLPSTRHDVGTTMIVDINLLQRGNTVGLWVRDRHRRQ